MSRPKRRLRLPGIPVDVPADAGKNANRRVGGGMMAKKAAKAKPAKETGAKKTQKPKKR
ncbi:MAG: hypothetical protein ACXAE3_04585 [Candidatus Kariarchaeaceae archaeon]